jgi:Zn-dependent protease
VGPRDIGIRTAHGQLAVWDGAASLAFQVSVWIIPVLLAVTLHEAAHGFAAYKLGDDTAKRAGRMTLNPFRHVDRFGTLILPGFLLLLSSPVILGYAKPVPVDFARLQHPRRDMALVAVAGPATNLVLMMIAIFLLSATALLSGEVRAWLQLNLFNMIILNAVLAVFNMLPIPPLDGSKVLAGILPSRLGKRLLELERYGLLFIFILLFLPYALYETLNINLPITRYLIEIPSSALVKWALQLV